MNTSPFVLASASATRRRMLQNAGVLFDVCPACVDEDALKQSLIAEKLPPRDIADALADAKARSVSMIKPDALVLGADQILFHGGGVVSKATTRDAAKETLKRLSASSHTLYSAAVIYEGSQPIWRSVDAATLSVRSLSDAFIDNYLTQIGDDAFWSVGVYQVESMGVQLFEKIDGDHFTILGLPLISVLDFLRRRAILPT